MKGDGFLGYISFAIAVESIYFKSFIYEKR